jgi:hypothetical protein
MAKPATESNVIKLPIAPPSEDWREKVKERDRREAKSQIIRTAVAFCAARGAIRGGFEADHTTDCVIANWSNTAGVNYEEVADQALVKLTRLMPSTRPSQRVSEVCKFAELLSGRKGGYTSRIY